MYIPAHYKLYNMAGIELEGFRIDWLSDLPLGGRGIGVIPLFQSLIPNTHIYIYYNN